MVIDISHEANDTGPKYISDHFFFVYFEKKWVKLQSSQV